VVAGLFLPSFQASQHVDVGFDTSNIVVATFDMELAGHDATQGAMFWQRLLERINANPDVQVASLAHKLPMSSRSQWAVADSGVETSDGERHGFLLSFRVVSTDYFATLGFHIVRGHGLSAEDVAGTPRVIVINETMAERLWPGQDPIGRALDNGRDQFEVVGIAADAVYHDLHEPTPGFGFLPLAQNYNEQMILHACLLFDDAAAVQQLRAVLLDFDPLAPVMNFARLDDSLRIRFLGDLVGASLSASFRTLSLILAVFGVYGVTSFWTTQRRGEIGIRLALGATAHDVVKWTIRRGLRAPGVGMLVGLGVALAVARLLGSLLSGISPFDVSTFLGVAGVLTCAGVFATWLPARAAAKVPPSEPLRAL
jgi:putative ABC transport system permease protein